MTLTSSASSACVAAPSEAVRRLAQHEGQVKLNRPAGQDSVFVVDMKLFQRRVLPKGDWHLDYVGGYGAVEDTSLPDGQVILLEEHFEKKRWVDDDGDEWVEETKGKLMGQTWNLSARMRRFQEVTIVFVAGLLKSEISWASYQVKRVGSAGINL